MVSGFVTSPCDQLRIFSGEARLIRIESKSAIKLALSYGEERYIKLFLNTFQSTSPFPNWAKETWARMWRLLCNSSFSPRRVPDPATLAASSLAPRPDRDFGARESVR